MEESSADLRTILPNYCPYIVEKNVSTEVFFSNLEYILKIPYSFGTKVLLISGFYKTNKTYLFLKTYIK